MLEIVTVGVATAPTVTSAAPFTLGSAFAAAETVTVPAFTPVTLPVASTEATVASLLDQVTVRSVTAASASTAADRVTEAPIWRFGTEFGVTVTPCTTLGAVLD